MIHKTHGLNRNVCIHADKDRISAQNENTKLIQEYPIFYELIKCIFPVLTLQIKSMFIRAFYLRKNRFLSLSCNGKIIRYAKEQGFKLYYFIRQVKAVS